MSDRDAFFGRIAEVTGRYFAWRERNGLMPATLADRRDMADQEARRLLWTGWDFDALLKVTNRDGLGGEG